jgi:hypothetical protein
MAQPKTKLQHRVCNLSKNKLSKLTPDQIQYGIDNCFYPGGVQYRNKIHCLECGISFNSDKTKHKCPECNQKLFMFGYFQGAIEEYTHLIIVDKCEEFQVIRYLCVAKTYKRFVPAKARCFESFQSWISPNGKITFIGLSKLSGLGYYTRRIWNEASIFSIRNNNYAPSGVIYPKKKITSLLKRNGFKYSFHNMRPEVVFTLLLQNNTAETLWKANQFKLFEYCMRNTKTIIDNWPSIKLCIRNNYIVNDANNWLDQIELLKFFNKDIRSPKYICPDDLHYEHQKYIAKKRMYERKIKKSKLIEQINIDQIEYEKSKGIFFGIGFNEGNIYINVIEHISDLLRESDILNHCAFENKYHMKNNSLLLSAKIDNKVIETIEINLKEMRIVQARGYNNKASKYHNAIISIVNKNINQIKKVYKQNKIAA